MISKNQKKTKRVLKKTQKGGGNQKFAHITNNNNNLKRQSYITIKEALKQSNLNKNGISQSTNLVKNKLKPINQKIYNNLLQQKEKFLKKRTFGKHQLSEGVKEKIQGIIQEKYSKTATPHNQNTETATPHNQNTEAYRELVGNHAFLAQRRNQEKKPTNPLNLKMCIASKGYFDEILPFLKLCNLENIFEIIFTSLDGNRKKDYYHELPCENEEINQIISSEISNGMCYGKKKPGFDHKYKKAFINYVLNEKYKTSNKPFTIYIDDNPEKDIINDDDFLVIKLKSNGSGLNMDGPEPKDELENLAFNSIKLIKEKIIDCQTRNRSVLLVFDFDCTITKKHLTFSLKDFIDDSSREFKNNFSTFLKENKTEILKDVSGVDDRDLTEENNLLIYKKIIGSYSANLKKKLKNYFINENVIKFLKNLKSLQQQSQPGSSQQQQFQPRQSQQGQFQPRQSQQGPNDMNFENPSINSTKNDIFAVPKELLKRQRREKLNTRRIRSNYTRDFNAFYRGP